MARVLLARPPRKGQRALWRTVEGGRLIASKLMKVVNEQLNVK